jgi:hypothetical protein
MIACLPPNLPAHRPILLARPPARLHDCLPPICLPIRAQRSLVGFFSIFLYFIPLFTNEHVYSQ